MNRLALAFFVTSTTFAAQRNPIKPGRLVPLRHPMTGKLDRNARIVDAFIEQGSNLPVATVKFYDGVERIVAADRIRLIGRSFGEQRRYLKQLDATARRAIALTFGRKPPRRAITQPEHRLVTGFQQKVQPGAEPVAYYHAGRVFLERDFYAFEPSTRIHEYMHALTSAHWYSEASARNYGWLDEGVGELLAIRACRGLGIRFAAPESYVLPRKVAAEIEGVVGRSVLENAFFRDGLLPLEAAYDAKKGPGSFALLMRLLEHRLTHSH